MIIEQGEYIQVRVHPFGFKECYYARCSFDLKVQQEEYKSQTSVKKHSPRGFFDYLISNHLLALHNWPDLYFQDNTADSDLFYFVRHNDETK
jgi:hypothetical protein